MPFKKDFLTDCQHYIPVCKRITVTFKLLFHQHTNDLNRNKEVAVYHTKKSTTSLPQRQRYKICTHAPGSRPLAIGTASTNEAAS